MTSQAFNDQAITHILTRLDVYSLNENIKSEQNNKTELISKLS